MPRSANEVMHDVIYAAVVDAIVALKSASGGLPNNLLRDIGAIHANTTFADLPKDVQAAIETSTRAAFTRLLREGYNVASSNAPPPPPRPQGPRRDGPSRGPRSGPGGDRHPRGGRQDGRGSRGPGSPAGKPRGPRSR